MTTETTPHGEGSANTSLFLTEAEAARALRLHPSTLGRLAKSGRAPVDPVHAGSRRLYPVAAIEALAKAPAGS